MQLDNAVVAHAGVHLCTWGNVDAMSSAVDLSLGVPANTLALIGLKGLPDEEMLLIPVKGSITNPRVDWAL